MAAWLRRLGPGAAWGLVVLAAFVAARYLEPRPFDFAQLRLFDFYQWVNPVKLPERHTVIIDIDEESLEKYGQWPWPRHLLAEVVRRVLAAEPAALGFDIVFAEHDRVSPRQLPASLAGLSDDLAKRFAGLPDTDAIFAEALGGGPVVLGQSAVPRKAGPGAPPALKAHIADLGRPALESLQGPEGVVRNLPEFEAVAAGIGGFTLNPEEDGIVRRLPTLLTTGKAIYPTLAIEMLRVAVGETTLAVRSAPEGGIVSVLVGDNEIPTDAQGRLWIRFAPHDQSLYVSAGDILDGKVDPARFAGKFVFLGVSAIGLNDNKTTPLDRLIPGVEVHAMLLDTLFAGALVVQPSWTLGAESALALAIGLLLLLTGGRLGARGLAVAVLLACLATWAGSWSAYAAEGVLFDAAFPATAWVLVGIVLGFANFRREEHRRKAVRDSFSRYVSPALVEQLAEHPEAIRLGGELRELTILFCDIRGFTGITERLDAEALIGLMNRYFTPMAGAVLDHRGMIDKYIGDAIMALWNAPLADPDHCRDAARAALEMRRRLVTLNDELVAEAAAKGEEFTPLRVGIGIATGPCAVGNIGAQQRLEYSALGDPVNLASRIESQTLRYGYDILVGETTGAELADFALLELDAVVVKGKTRPIRIYALVGDERLAARPDFIRLQSFHRDLLHSYRSRQWAAARDVALECRQLGGEFGLRRAYKKFLQRIETNEQRALPDNWDGVHVAERK